MSKELPALCNAVSEAALEAVGWVGNSENSDLVGAERNSITRQLRRGALRARILGRAAGRPMCVGVFGPSQAGKSFLVSVLARPQGGRLVSDFPAPDGRLDFIKEINPEGEGESTGLVTRFTIKGYEAPDGFPVKLQLLTEADIGRILTNSFLMDGDVTEPEPSGDEISEWLKKFAAQASDKNKPGVTQDEVWATQEYLEKNFSGKSYVAALKPFWDEASEIAPRLEPEDRAEFFSIMWGRHQALTTLYAKLALALVELGHVGEAFAGMDALIPREESIIDVKLLDGLDGDGGMPLRLHDGAGRQLELPKSVVAALTAELVMPMAEKPWEMFEHTDLLDFPGARSRFKTDLKKFFATAESPVKESFLRGKVAYLFDRYVAEQELTSMLLCIPDSNMEVVDLPGLVDDWIVNTHGATPEQRASITQILFFVFTKFDKHLIDSAGSGDDATTRFERRVEASLLQPFGRQPDSWPKNWSGGQPFKNCFWLRNPNYPAEAVIAYDDDGRETGYLPKKVERIEELKRGCLSSDLVRRHFKDPVAAWDAAMSLNDGGVSYMVGSLTPVCQPEIKSVQISAQLERLKDQLAQQISRFYVSDDLEKRLTERRAAADDAVDAIDEIVGARRFGAFLEGLMLDPDKLSDRLIRTPDNIRFVSSMAEATAGNGGAMSRIRPGPPRKVRPGAARGDNGNGTAKRIESSIRSMKRSTYQAETALEIWMRQLRDLANRPDLETRLYIRNHDMNEIVGELISGSRRYNLCHVIEQQLDEKNYLERAESLSALVALIASEVVNKYVARLGVEFIDFRDRPDVDTGSGTRKAFAPRPVDNAVKDLPKVPYPSESEFVTDWLFMLYKLFEDNALDTKGTTSNIEQNMKLGQILGRLNSHPAPEPPAGG